MATAKEKREIFEEESLRHKIRLQLERQGERQKAGKSTWAKVWSALNSAFLLWLLSSVVVGLITYKVQQWQKDKEAEQHRQEQIQTVKQDRSATARRLDVEISSRLNYVNNLLDVKSKAVRSKRPPVEGYTEVEISGEVLAEAIMLLEKPSKADYPISIFQDYNNRSLQSLLWELSECLSKTDDVTEDEKNDVETAYQQSRSLARTYHFSNKSKTIYRWVREDGADSQAQTLIHEFRVFNIERWGFPLKPLSHY